jgi:biotin synthase
MLFKKLGINSEKTRTYSDEAYEAALVDEINQQQGAEQFIDAAAKYASEAV